MCIRDSYWLVYKSPGINALKKLTLEFCGIKPVKKVRIGPIRLSKDSYRCLLYTSRCV